MDIDIYSASKQASIISAQLENATASETTTTTKTLAPLLGGKSLTISAALGGDLQALLERLKSEQDRTRFSLLLSSLQSINASLSDTQRAALEQGIVLSEKLDTLNSSLADETNTQKTASAEYILMEAKIKALQDQIDAAVQEGKDHIEQTKEMNRLREELAAKEQVIADTTGKINEINNQIGEVKGKMSVAISAVGENALKTIANELAAIIKPEELETSAELDKREKIAEENDPFRAIRKSLDEIKQDMQDTIDANTSDIMA